MFEILDIQKFKDALIDQRYFPYCQVDCVIHDEQKQDLASDFPSTSIRGSIPAEKLNYGPSFAKLMQELHSDALKDLVAEKFAIDLSDAQPMLTIRGQTTLADGKIHVDKPSKLMTLLLYLNEDWHASTGNLRLLKDADSLEHYFDEIRPSFGKFLVFKVTDNCWHGHYPFEGRRQTLQLNYVRNEKIVAKELKKHARSYVFKQFKQKIQRVFARFCKK